MMGVVGQKWRTSGYHWVCVNLIVSVSEKEIAYLVHDIFERIGTVDGEANEKQIGLGV
jgi:hypothetical protein